MSSDQFSNAADYIPRGRKEICGECRYLHSPSDDGTPIILKEKISIGECVVNPTNVNKPVTVKIDRPACRFFLMKWRKKEDD